MEYQQNFKQ